MSAEWPVSRPPEPARISRRRADRGGRDQRRVVPGEGPAERIDGVTDRGQHLGLLIGPEPSEATRGGKQLEPLLARIWLLPVELPQFGITEPSALADPVGDLG